MLYLLPFLSLLLDYGMIGCTWYAFLRAESLSPVFYGTLPLFAAVAVVCTVTLVWAVGHGRRWSREESIRVFRLGVVWKVLAIPYFLLNLLAWTAVSAAFLVVPGLQIFLLGLPLAALATYLPLLSSTAYTVTALSALRRVGMEVRKCHTVCQFLFVLDTLDALWMVFRLRKEGAPETVENKEP